MACFPGLLVALLNVFCLSMVSTSRILLDPLANNFIGMLPSYHLREQHCPVEPRASEDGKTFQKKTIPGAARLEPRWQLLALWEGC